MFRKMLVAAVLTVSSVMATTANAANYAAHPARHCYKVFVRDHCNKPWHYYGEYHNHDQARNVAHHLRHQGYEVDIRG